MSRLAVLLPGSLAEPASEPPIIVLMWKSLGAQKQFPATAVNAYQAAIKRSVRIRETPSSAHIRVDEAFGKPQVRALLRAMRNLVNAARPDLAETPPPSRPVTPDNVRQTLTGCPPAVRTVFKTLIFSWQAAGGTVQAKDAGRISLKMKTKAHESGWCARLPRNFSLLVLVAPRGAQPAHIQAEWNLAQGQDTAYLDCIPEAVAAYERTVTALPGFTRKGTLTRIMLDAGFVSEHRDSLVQSIVQLRAAEQEAP